MCFFFYCFASLPFPFMIHFSTVTPSDGAARGSGSANSGGSARFSRQRKRKGKRHHEKWRQRKRKGKRYHEKRRQRKRKGKRCDYRCLEGSDNYRCPSLHLYFLLSYFVTFLLTSKSVKRVTLIFYFLSTLVFDNLSLFIYLSSIIIIIHFMHLVLHGVSEPCPY